MVPDMCIHYPSVFVNTIPAANTDSGLVAETTETVGTTVTVSTDETVIQVEGTDVTSALEVATQAAEDAGMVMEEREGGGYLKSIVYGGLDVSLTSLGVVAAAAGGDAKTRKHFYISRSAFMWFENSLLTYTDRCLQVTFLLLDCRI